ncbi:MAG TPA: hypothetical protein VHI52_14160 [Verrucomicrobiae bacterium]|nr:hypothetical protein [Verrucomicrobiae bacterium]
MDCIECKSHFFKPGISDMFCRRWKVRLYRARYGSLNMFCSKYRMVNKQGPTLGVLAGFMRPTVLYSIFYNDVWDPMKLREVRDLKTRRFLDGHGANGKA